MDTSYASGLVWLRRDLRLDDHAALSQALAACHQVHCCFVFDTAILAPLPRRDRRIEFIHAALAELDAALRAAGGPGCGLLVLHGDAAEEVPRLAQRLGVQAVFANHDYEPAAIARDALVRERLAADGRALHTFKDQVLFERDEVRTQVGQPYTVFTPYSRAWRAKLDAGDLRPRPVDLRRDRLAPLPPGWPAGVPSLQALGFEATNLRALPLPLGPSGGLALLEEFGRRIDDYHHARELPAVRGPSYLGPHLRFGTVSIRRAAALAQARAGASEGAATWLKELCWREFYFQLLAHHPRLAAGESFRPAYDRIAWEQGPEAEARFAAWCAGRTGYPLVDAAMRQLEATGYMHNRLRMVAASFLCKDLGVDWRRGEAWFAGKLNDYDFAANNGGWQWASSSGCDAQPWFRIFNPVTQSRRFDPQGAFILRYLPQLAKLPTPALHAPWTARPVDLEAAGLRLGQDYPPPIVDHAQAREATLRRYAVVKD